MPDSRPPQTTLPVDLKQKASLIEQQWSPRVDAEMNDDQFKGVLPHFHGRLEKG